MINSRYRSEGNRSLKAVISHKPLMITDATSLRPQLYTEEDGQDELIVPWINRDGEVHAGSTAEDEAFSPPSSEPPDSSNQPNSKSNQDNDPLSRGFSASKPQEYQGSDSTGEPCILHSDFDQRY